MQRAFLATCPASSNLALLEPPHLLQIWLSPGVPHFPRTRRSQLLGCLGLLAVGHAAVPEYILPRSETKGNVEGKGAWPGLQVAGRATRHLQRSVPTLPQWW